jgi:hypothetical protein
MSRRPSPGLHSLWRARVSRQLLSGLSVEQFCAKEQCAKSAFYRWKRELVLTDPSYARSTLPTPSTFLPVTVRINDSHAHQPAPIEADLPNGIRLRIPTANVHLACRLVRAVARTKTDSGGLK